MSGREETAENGITTITVPKTLRDELELLKKVPQEPLYAVIQRLLQMRPRGKNNSGA